MLKPWDQFPAVQDSPESGVVSIIGAGLAGCWMARILAERDIQVSLFEKNTHVALEASGNPVGIVKPYVTRSISSGMSFHCRAHEFLLDRLAKLNLESAADLHRCGVLQLVHSAYQNSRYYDCMSSEASTQFTGLDINSAALLFNASGWLNPNALCNALVKHANIKLHIGFELCAVEESSDNTNHRLLFSNNEQISSRHSVFTMGAAIELLPGQKNIPLTPARGQISRFSLASKSDKLKCVVNGKHYAIPSNDSVYVGATFDRGNTNTEVTDTDHASNLAGLHQLLPDLKVDPNAVEGFAAIRATTPDRLPLVGPLPDFSLASETYHDIRHGKALQTYPHLPCKPGFYVIAGLGSRGIVTAPLCAQLLTNYLLNEMGDQSQPDGMALSGSDEGDTPLHDWSALLNPARFLIRQLKRQDA